MFTEAFEDLLRGHCTPALVRAIESGGAPEPLWKVVADAGFLELMASEDAGGAGLDLAGVLPILCALGTHAVPLPLGQAIALRALLPAGVSVPEGLPTLAPALVRQGDGSLIAPQVPYGAVVDTVLGELDGELWLLNARMAQHQITGVPREATSSLSWDSGVLERAGRCLGPAVQPGAVASWGAALHAALLAGALARCFELALQHCNDRMQFGKSIGKFQAIQHQLAVMAEQVAAARIAVGTAFRPGRSCPAGLPAAIAKARASEAVTVVAPIAHAVHGAMGVTEEYDLQLFTRRLHSWRLAHGSETGWHRVVGQALLDEEPSIRVGDFVRALM